MAQRSSIEKLPEAVRHEFERKLVENGFSDYQAIAEWLQDQGYEISRSAAHRYGQKVQRRFAAIKSSTEAARLIAEGAADEGDTRSEALIPNDSSVEIHEASGKSSSVDAFDKLLKECKSGINIALLGQDQTTDKETNHASASAGLEIADDIRDGDRRIVEAAFNELIEWVVELNFGDVACPKFELFENEEAGTKERAERDSMLSGAGVKFTPQYWKRTYGLEDGDIVEEDAIIPTAADFAEGWDGTETDAGLILDTLAPNAGRLNQQGRDLTALLVQDLQRGETEDNILDRLAEQFPNMDDTALQNELARVIFLSGLVGRIEAAQEMS